MKTTSAAFALCALLLPAALFAEVKLASPFTSHMVLQREMKVPVWGTAEAGANLRLGRRIVSLDLDARAATDDAGERYGWEKLLLATGGRPRTIPGTDGVVYFRSFDDYRMLRGRVHQGASAVVIGGGFIGSEIAAALATNGCRVTMVFPEAGLAWRILPAGLSDRPTQLWLRSPSPPSWGQRLCSLTGIGGSASLWASRPSPCR